MKSLVKFTDDGKKICGHCERVESEIVIFRKRRNQCIDCVNIVRRAGHQRKIRVEQTLLEENGTPVFGRYKKELKKQWYEDNKDRLSKENKVKYLNNRENRLSKANERYYDPKKIISTLLKGAKERSKRYSTIFDLDEKFVGELYQQQSGKCALTGIEFVFQKENNTSRRPFAPSIDRINCELGYTKNNIRIVCIIVNMSLNEFGDKIFDKMCKAYVSFNL